MKRISRIEIENSRAYYSRLTFSLDKGENLLLYGENGSGKTSLYKTLNDFIQSFYSPVEYTQNWYKPAGAVSEIVLRIGDYDQATRQFSNELDFRFGEGVDNTNVQNTAYLKALALSKGFLNYRDLLKMYLYEEDTPNLFDFFVLNLLKNHVPLAQGMRNSIIKEWKLIQDEIFQVYHRGENKHHRGLARLTFFETALRAVMDDLFAEVNRYLNTYFGNFTLQIGYDLKPMVFSYGNRKGEWNIRRDLRLNVSYGHAHIDGYTEGLNEARLSAIAICLYLAALRSNPGADMRLMFLDDIFIGIDSSNRLPILKILNQEFFDFQIIIATYDRSWYCLATKYLTNLNPDAWKYMSLFSRPINDNGLQFMEPVKVNGDSLFERAKQYLHGGREIDLPAAANYFRKALEELLSDKHLPREMFLNDDYSVIPGFKLTTHVKAVTRLFSQVGLDLNNIQVVDAYLHPLIHPLSHYEDEAPMYRNELIEVEKAICGLMEQINVFPHKCRLLEGKGNELCIQYNKADGSYLSNYFVTLEDNLWLYKDGSGNAKLTDCRCKMFYMDGEENGVALTPYVPSHNTKLRYVSLDDALRQIYDYEVNNKHHDVVPSNDYDIVFVSVEKKVKKCIKTKRNALLSLM